MNLEIVALLYSSSPGIIILRSQVCRPSQGCPTPLRKRKVIIMGNPVNNDEASLLAASKAYISGKIDVKELRKAQRTYAPELFKEVKKPPLQSLIEEVITKIKGDG